MSCALSWFSSQFLDSCQCYAFFGMKSCNGLIMKCYWPSFLCLILQWLMAPLETPEPFAHCSMIRGLVCIGFPVHIRLWEYLTKCNAPFSEFNILVCKMWKQNLLNQTCAFHAFCTLTECACQNESLHICPCKLTPWSIILLEKIIVTHPFKKFPALFGTWRFITVFTRVHHWSLSWARWIQSTPSHPLSLRFISHLCLGLPSGPFPSGFLTKILHVFLVPPIHVTCPTHVP